MITGNNMIQISRTDLKLIGNLRLFGFSKFQTRMNCSRIWQKLERIGLSSVEDEKQFAPREPEHTTIVGAVFKYEKFTGKVLLEIRGRGVRERKFINGSVTKDRAILDSHRKSFKNEVHRSIKSFHPTCGEYFNLLLHYNCGAMNKLELEDTTKH